MLNLFSVKREMLQRALGIGNGARADGYRFSLPERIAGVGLRLRQHPGKPLYQTSACGERLEKVVIGDCTVYVPRHAFQPFELPMLYNEVFRPGIVNPHAYLTHAVSIHEGDYVVDAGSCEGFFTLLALRHAAGKVYAFEPLQPLCEGLQRTFAAHGARVEIIGKALSDKAGGEKIAREEDEGTISSSHFDARGDEMVETTTLDDFVAGQARPRIDFIKADVEGAEVKMVLGAIHTIRRFKPRLSIAVYHEYENAMLIRDIILDMALGYTVEFGGCYTLEKPYRPFMLYAHC